MFTELRVHLASDPELSVVVQNTQPAMAGPPLVPGDTVGMAWSAHACRLDD